MKRIFQLRVLGADYGDCLWIEYGDSTSPHRILVDAGTPGTFNRLKPLLDSVRGDEPSHELFLITHVDEDHIGGSLKVLADAEASSQFKHVWFNGRRHLLAAAAEEDFGPVQGERLTRFILDRQLPWNKHFGNGPVARNADGRPLIVELPGGAVATILTPSLAQLSKLLPVWDKVIKAAGLDPDEVAVPEAVVDGEEAFGTDVEALANIRSKEDAAPANGSSIAMLLEYNGQRMLLGADAHPGDLLAGIHALTGGTPLKVDVFKLPHHGSKANVTDALLAAVDAEVIVFSTNGQRFEHPDREAVARTIRRYKGQGKLIFNYDSSFTRIWQDPVLQQQWQYTVEYGSGEDGFTVSLS